MCLVPGKCTTSGKLHADIFQRSRLDMAILLPRIIASYCICGHTKCHTWAKIPPLLDVEGPALHSTTRRFRDLCLRFVDSGWRLGATKKQVRLCLSASSVSGSHTTSPTHLQDLARIAQSAIRLQDATMEIHGIIYGMVAQLQTAAAASA